MGFLASLQRRRARGREYLECEECDPLCEEPTVGVGLALEIDCKCRGRVDHGNELAFIERPARLRHKLHCMHQIVEREVALALADKSCCRTQPPSSDERLERHGGRDRKNLRCEGWRLWIQEPQGFFDRLEPAPKASYDILRLATNALLERLGAWH